MKTRTCTDCKQPFPSYGGRPTRCLSCQRRVKAELGECRAPVRPCDWGEDAAQVRLCYVCKRTFVQNHTHQRTCTPCLKA